MKIAVAGTGYVGLSIATLLAQHNTVTAVDIIPEKVELINNRKSPIQDDYIEKYLAEKKLDLTATLDAESAYKDADFVVIAAPTNYDSKKNFFDTSAVEAVIELVMKYNPNAIMVIKSTIPVGYTKSIREKTGSENIIFSPEFLRESKALYDNLYPSRIIVGTDMNDERLVKAAHTFAELLQQGAIKENIRTRKDPADPLARGALKPCYLEAEQEQWLLEQAGKHGFALTEGAFRVTRKQTCHFRKNGKRPVTLLAVTYEGILQVTDPEAFREMLCQGIGRGKAYGLGLMTILHGGSSHG